jgi:tRNA A-37 threonylcarbamoyl transferase component Bud32
LSESIKDKEKDLLIASNIHSFFKKLRWINFNHGDSKTSNFFLHQDKLITFDLDTSKKYVTSWVAKKKLDKDISRILRSVGMNNRLLILLRRRIER